MDADDEIASAEQGGLKAIATIDTMVTVVDAFNFFNETNTDSLLIDRFAKQDVPEGDKRTISDLFIDQIEFANGQFPALKNFA